jgi:hypothetical protein
MTHGACPDCRLRFTHAATACLPACPICGEPLQPLGRLAEAVGFRLFRADDVQPSLPQAVEVALPPPAPGGGRA